MDITAKITGIKYSPKLTPELQQFEFGSLDINNLPPSCIVNYGKFSFGLSKWVSPKRTRSYPYTRVYNTLGTAKRITVIPIIKDEGKNGDRDFIQWDTVSLMSLLDVFVVFAYYKTAEKHKTRFNKITNQKFDNELVKNKIAEIKNYHSSALHWNLKEISDFLPTLINKVKETYSNLSKELGVKFHSTEGIEKFAEQFLKGASNFRKISREKAKEAQRREAQTIQPKESLSTLTKATITIKNYLGGEYYFTTDEIRIESNKIFLIEGKHSKHSIIPSLDDIKDGLLKMMLYSNLEDVFVNGEKYTPVPVLKLTSPKIKYGIQKPSTQNLPDFLSLNGLNKFESQTISKLFEEAEENNFQIIVEKSQ